MEVIGRGSITIVDGAALRDRRLGGPRPPAADDQRRRPAFAAGRLPLRPAAARARRGARACTRFPAARPPRASGGSRRPTPWPAGACPCLAPSRRSPTARVRCLPAAPAPTLRILETRVLRGPNYWAREPVIRLLVDLGVLEEYPSNLMPGFTDALIALLPTLEDHACSLGRRGGFITRLRDGTWAGHVAEHVALELQNLAGTDVRHGKTRAAGLARPVQRHLRVPRGDGRPRGRRIAVAPRQPPRRARRPAGPSTSRPSWSSSSGSPSGRPSARRRRRSSTRPSAATSRSSASTATRWSSSARASTSSGSGRR